MLPCRVQGSLTLCDPIVTTREFRIQRCGNLANCYTLVTYLLALSLLQELIDFLGVGMCPFQHRPKYLYCC